MKLKSQNEEVCGMKIQSSLTKVTFGVTVQLSSARQNVSAAQLDARKTFEAIQQAYSQQTVDASATTVELQNQIKVCMVLQVFRISYTSLSRTLIFQSLNETVSETDKQNKILQTALAHR